MARFSPVQRHPKRSLRANYLLVENIRALLAARGTDDKALAMWCGHKPAWLSKILSGERGIKLPDLDKVADFFGLTVAQLFHHGISGLTERRHTQRRNGGERRTAERRDSSDARGLHPEVCPFPRNQSHKWEDENVG